MHTKFGLVLGALVTKCNLNMHIKPVQLCGTISLPNTDIIMNKQSHSNFY